MDNDINVVKCKNGHFYDGDIFESCPECSKLSKDVNHNSVNDICSAGKSLRGLFHKGGKKKEDDNPPVEPLDNEDPKPAVRDSGDKPLSSDEEIHVNIPNKYKESTASGSDATQDFWERKMKEKEKKTPNSTYDPNPNQKSGPVDEPENKDENSNKTDKDIQKEVLTDIVQKASARDENKTLSFFNRTNEQRKKETSPNKAVDPVVGWLVCVSGEHFGESFSIFEGNNSIGRSDSNEIVIDKDGNISREKHSIIIFEPNQNKFYIQSGNSRGLTYLNGAFISSTTELSNKDIIAIGKSEFMFVPLCSEDFTWEDYI